MHARLRRAGGYANVNRTRLARHHAHGQDAQMGGAGACRSFRHLADVPTGRRAEISQRVELRGLTGVGLHAAVRGPPPGSLRRERFRPACLALGEKVA